jgi:glutaminyl-tRNA synthetase
MRDPVIYRILHSSHHQTGDKWCIYPMYDYAHPIEDAVEGITHSICTLEFEDHRPFYDWVVKECEMELIPRQIEFARLAMTDTVMSKRYLKMLVDEKIADGWDDPRLPTVSGLRRRGYTKEAIKEFVRGVGVSKSNSIVDGALLDHYIREDLKLKVNRTMAVIDPLKVIIENYPDNEVEYLDVENNQENELSGTRKVPFSKEIYIERDDFSIDPPKGYKRLTKENEVRLKNAYFIKLKEIIFNEDGSIKELIVTYDPKTKSGSGFDERKPKGTIHWVDKNHCVPATFNLYEPIMLDSIQSDNFMDRLNPNSHFVLNGFVEENIKGSEPLTSFQFFRHGYFTVDSKHSTKEKLVFNRIVSLKSSF